MTNHPIIPPPELVQQWASAFYGTTIAPGEAAIDVATQAARWGADQELEACCELLRQFGFNETLPRLQRIRRPKPPSLKEQGLGALKLLKQRTTDPNIIEPLTRALEALPE
jgi:hypothetical protein